MIPPAAFGRCWRHVDFEAGWLRLDPGETKNKKARNFPMHMIPRLREALERQWQRKLEVERRTGRVIESVFFYYDTAKRWRAGEPVKAFRNSWAIATKAAGHPDLLVHDFRRTAARNLIRAGVPQSVSMQLTGHETDAMFRRYGIVDEGMLEDAGAKLAKFYERQARQTERKIARRRIVPL